MSQNNFGRSLLVWIVVQGCLLVSCSSDISTIKKRLMGKWERQSIKSTFRDGSEQIEKELPATIQFFEDGTYRKYLMYVGNRFTIRGTYKLSGSDKIKFKIVESDTPVSIRDAYTVEYTLLADKLTFINFPPGSKPGEGNKIVKQEEVWIKKSKEL